VFDESSREEVPCDTVLLAAGQNPDLAFLEEGGEDVESFRPGWPRVDPETLETTADGVFVAGDLAHGTRLLIDAVASGKKAARSIYRHVTGCAIRAESLEVNLSIDMFRRERGYESRRRLDMRTLPPAERLADPRAVVEIGYDEDEARYEASRCLDCGVTPVFDGARCVLCGGCVDVCPTLCLKLVPLSMLEPTDEIRAVIGDAIGEQAGLDQHSAILKDEDRCIRCGLCEQRCPVEAISMERIGFETTWRTA